MGHRHGKDSEQSETSQQNIEHCEWSDWRPPGGFASKMLKVMRLWASQMIGYHAFCNELQFFQICLISSQNNHGIYVTGQGYVQP